MRATFLSHYEIQLSPGIHVHYSASQPVTGEESSLFPIEVTWALHSLPFTHFMTSNIPYISIKYSIVFHFKDALSWLCITL